MLLAIGGAGGSQRGRVVNNTIAEIRNSFSTCQEDVCWGLRARLLIDRNRDVVVINHVLLGSGSYRNAISVASTTFGETLLDRTRSDLCDYRVTDTHRRVR